MVPKDKSDLTFSWFPSFLVCLSVLSQFILPHLPLNSRGLQGPVLGSSGLAPLSHLHLQLWNLYFHNSKLCPQPQTTYLATWHCPVICKSTSNATWPKWNSWSFLKTLVLNILHLQRWHHFPSSLLAKNLGSFLDKLFILISSPYPITKTWEFYLLSIFVSIHFLHHLIFHLNPSLNLLFGLLLLPNWISPHPAPTPCYRQSALLFSNL